MDMEGAIKQLQETAVVVAGIQARQAEVLKAHGQWLEKHQNAIAKHEEWWANHQKAMADLDRKNDRDQR
jgi:hypothetical protein